MRPIPRALLRHTISYVEVENDIEPRYSGDEGFKLPISVTNVCVQPSYSKIKTSSGEEKSNKSLLIIDAYTSKPLIKPIYGSKIIFNGEEMVIQNIKEFYDGDKLHHYEVDLT